MPVRTHKIEGGARVLLFTCEICGGSGHFSLGAQILVAVQEGKPSLAGRWFCGWLGGAPACVAVPGQGELAL